MKTLAPFVFDSAECRAELDKFKAILDSKSSLSERADLLPLFRECTHLTALLGALFPGIGPADRVAYEFSVFGDFASDIVIGNAGQQVYCAVELEDAGPDSVFHCLPGRSTTEWGKRFEHGFSQLIDWFFAWDDQKATFAFEKHFGHGPVDLFGMLLIGRSSNMSDHDRRRLRWRADRVSINTHKILCSTYDELYERLNREWNFRSSTPSAS
jgi:hypothetical protein